MTKTTKTCKTCGADKIWALRRWICLDCQRDLARMDADTAEKAEACGVAADFTPAEKKARRIAKIDLQIEAVRERTSDECFVALITDRGW
jgi:hypothetical protein